MEEKLTKAMCFNPVLRDCCFSTLSSCWNRREQRKFQSRLAGLLFFYDMGPIILGVSPYIVSIPSCGIVVFLLPGKLGSVPARGRFQSRLAGLLFFYLLLAVAGIGLVTKFQSRLAGLLFFYGNTWQEL